jgi:hypothetical protein
MIYCSVQFLGLMFVAAGAAVRQVEKRQKRKACAAFSVSE